MVLIEFPDPFTAPCEDVQQKSRLFLAIKDILGDQNCLCHFLQFMEAEGAVPLIKFWLAVDHFRLSAQAMVEQRNGAESSNKCDIEDRPLTDDEKSEIICSQNGDTQQLPKSRTSNRATSTKRNSQFQTTVATDALKIIEKFLCANSDSWIDVPATIHSNISLSMGNCDESTSFVAPDCFSVAQQFVVERLEREFLRRFLDSEFYCKYCLEILTGGNLRLADILYSECALFYFMEFLEQEQQRDYLDFWMAATNFRRHARDCSASSQSLASGDAMVLYEKYFSLQATNPLKLSDQVRSRVEQGICATGEDNLLVGCFDLAIRIVEKWLEDFYLERFLASELFFKHVSDLVNRSQHHHPKVQRTQSLTGGGGGRVQTLSKRNSDGETILRRSNSTVSVSSSSGSRDQEQPVHQVAKLGSTVELRIDPRMFCNGGKGVSNPTLPNSSRSLSFGRVNALGRFERDFDWDEGAAGGGGAAGSAGCGGGLGGMVEESAGSRLKKAMKKLVNLSEDRVQEELAWQVAEMIVKDVTDITMNNINSAGGRGVDVTENGERRRSVMVVEEEEGE